MAGKKRKVLVGDADESGKAKVKQAKKDRGLSDFGNSLWKPALLLLITVVIVSLHRYHISTMFENDRHFSHLSSLEREMTFRTEMGLYFSYYKTIIEAPSFMDGLNLIMKDNVTEYPDTINTLKRFNLYPEVIIGGLFRIYFRFAETFGIVIKQCWKTERGKDLPPIISCEGMGDPYYFYVNSAFALASTLAGTLFLHGCLISGSIFGGLIAVAAFVFNHGEATRVQWSPPLRETFGYPIFAMQLLVVTFIIKHRKQGVCWSLIIAGFTVSFMLPWQFAQFALSTQVGSLFVAYMLDYIPASTLRTITFGHLFGFLVSFGFLFGNEMLLTSLFLSSLLTTLVMLLLQNVIYKLRLRFLIWTIQAGMFAVGTLGLKFLIGNLLDIHDDAHVFDILKSKFTNYSNFHTQLYTCAAEFDFLAPETYWKLTLTLLLPSVIVSLGIIVLQVFKQEKANLLFRNPVCEKPYAELIYNVVQLAAFTVMTVIIMRLKLFWTPHLCVLAGVVAHEELIGNLTRGWMRPLWHRAVCVGLVALMAYEGMRNLQHQRSIMGEYSNPTQEALFEWIVKNTTKDAVFVGTMPTMANVKLSTLRPITMHPHYEDVGLRDRVMKAYSVYSRKSFEEAFQILKDMKANYLIFEMSWCSRGGKPGCSMPELWDYSDIANRGKTPICEKFQKGDFGPFKLLYKNDHYGVFLVQ